MGVSIYLDRFGHRYHTEEDCPLIDGEVEEVIVEEQHLSIAGTAPIGAVDGRLKCPECPTARVSAGVSDATST